jgi:hypothetical protein
MDEKFGDISFAVGGIAAEEESEKVAKTLTPMFPCSSGISYESVQSVYSPITVDQM